MLQQSIESQLVVLLNIRRCLAAFFFFFKGIRIKPEEKKGILNSSQVFPVKLNYPLISKVKNTRVAAILQIHQLKTDFPQTNL